MVMSSTDAMVLSRLSIKVYRGGTELGGGIVGNYATMSNHVASFARVLNSALV